MAAKHPPQAVIPNSRAKTTPAADASPVPPRLRVIHFFYRHSSTLNHFLRGRMRGPGIACGIIIINSALFILGNPRTPLIQIFALAGTASLVTLILAFLRRSHLLALRSPPRHATAGETTRYPVKIENLGKRRLRHAWLAESPPDPRPPLADFARTPEPGESERNAFDRFFLYYRWRWLLERRRAFDGGESTASVSIDPGQTVTAWISLTPKRRGVVALDDLRVLLPDPLGFFQRRRWVAAPPATLTVLPRRYRLPAIDIPGAPRFQIGGETTSQTVGASDEFIGLRDYRPGDPLRLIHWRSWARTGRPIVRELEDTFFPRHGLVLDTFPPAGHDLGFEEAISVAASFASTVDGSECLLDLMFVHGKAHTFTAGRGIARAEKMLEVLAGAEADPNAQNGFETLVRLVVSHRDDLGSCLCVLVGWDEPRAEFIRQLSRGGIRPILLVVTQTLGQTASAIDENPPQAPHLLLDAHHVQRDLAGLPRLMNNAQYAAAPQ